LSELIAFGDADAIAVKALRLAYIVSFPRR
jgi:hypothetical protein